MADIKIFLVGGAVRDQFLGHGSKDKDFVVVAPSFDAMREVILAKGGKIFLETPKFFTIRANVPGIGSADFVLARKDGAYTDGRHPDTVEVGTIEDDLARRDFTMNAIAIDTENEFNVVDPFRGIQDIVVGMIRAVGNAQKRLEEDKLRAFRAIRFSVTKNFRIENSLDAAICKLAMHDFHSVSTERIREELLKMFQANSFRSIELLNQYPTLFNVVKYRNIWFKPTTERV
jgi:tRNA nucleotidyltransferase (CCA-adding enzyme)